MANLLFSNIRKKDTRHRGAPRISNWSIVIRGNNKNNDNGDPWDLPESLFATFCILYRILCCTENCDFLVTESTQYWTKSNYREKCMFSLQIVKIYILVYNQPSSWVRSHAPSIQSHRGTKVVWPDFQQWESQKNRFALIYFGKIQFLPPCIWNLPFMSTAYGLYLGICNFCIEVNSFTCSTFSSEV